MDNQKNIKSDTNIIIETIPLDSISDIISNISDSLTAPKELIKKGKSKDFILQCNNQIKQEVISDINYYREKWSKVPNPLIAKYLGNDFGDYFHLLFEDINGENHDFGLGNNNLNEIQLYNNNEQLSDNVEYLNKKFKIFWNWKVSSYPCCSGGYDNVKAYHPSIIKLELNNNE